MTQSVDNYVLICSVSEQECALTARRREYRWILASYKVIVNLGRFHCIAVLAPLQGPPVSKRCKFLKDDLRKSHMDLCLCIQNFVGVSDIRFINLPESSCGNSDGQGEGKQTISELRSSVSHPSNYDRQLAQSKHQATHGSLVCCHWE